MKFNYLSRTKEGQVQTGTIEAVNQAAAIQILQGRNLVLTEIEPVERTALFSKGLKIFERVKKKDTVIFSRQLSTLVGAEVPLVQSLRALGRQIKNVFFKDSILEIARDVDGGMLFSQALSKHPKIFSPFYVNLIKSGEVSGRLEESLNYLADHLEREYYLISKVRGAMIYPAFILGAFFLVGILMMVMVVPQLIAILKETGQALPLPTRIIIWLSGALRSYGWVFGLIFIGLGIGFWQYIKRPAGRKIWDMIKLKLPIFGRIFQETYLARFTENLSTLIKGGLPIIQALNVSGEVVGNIVFQRIIFEARDEVRGGHTISSVLEKHKEFPAMVIQMMKTGEKTGKLDSILENLAVFYSKEVDNIVSNLSQLIEPMLIIGLGIMVGILVAAILMPIYNIAGGL